MKPALRKLPRSHPILKAARAYKRVWKGICGGGSWNDIHRNAMPLLARMARQAQEASAATTRIAP